jgi:protein-tyrosine phosphatase family protein
VILNLFQVSPRIWRSGQPALGDWPEVAKLGIKKVLKLNVVDFPGIELRDDPGATDVGCKVFEVPFPDRGAVEVEQGYRLLKKALWYLEWDEGPWLVHCTEGLDRTGLVIAAWRATWTGGTEIGRDWTCKAAYEEWVKLGSHRYPGLEAVWERGSRHPVVFGGDAG